MELINRSIICIDLKSFFASCECVVRGLDPFTTPLVVADPTTNERHFEVINNATGEKISNYPVPSNLVLNGMDIDYDKGIAINRDVNTQYNVIARPSGPSYYNPNQANLDPNAAQALQDLNDTPEAQEKRPKPIVKTKSGREAF